MDLSSDRETFFGSSELSETMGITPSGPWVFVGPDVTILTRGVVEPARFSEFVSLRA
jgi:hypothetical protein